MTPPTIAPVFEDDGDWEALAVDELAADVNEVESDWSCVTLPRELMLKDAYKHSFNSHESIELKVDSTGILIAI